MKNKKLIQYMGRVFLSFLLAIGIPVTILTAFYLSSIVTKQREQEDRQYYQSVQQNFGAVSAFIGRAVEFTAFLSKDAHLREVQNDAYRNTVYSYLQLLDSMRAFCENRDAKTECALYIEHSRQVLSTQLSVCSAEQFPEYAQLQAFLEQRANTACQRSGTKLMVMMTQPKYYFDSSVVFIYYIDLEPLFAAQADSNYSVFSSDGAVLFGEGLPQAAGERLLREVQAADSGSFDIPGGTVWYQTEFYGKIILANRYDADAFMGLGAQTVFAAVATVTGSLLCVCTIAFFAARQYTKPVQRLSEQIERFPEQGDPGQSDGTIFDSIFDALLMLQTQNRRYREIADQNRKIIEDQTVRDLLWSRLPAGYDMQSFLRERGMAVSGDSLCPLWMTSGIDPAKSSFAQRSEMNALMKELLVEYFEEKKVLAGSCLWELDKTFLLLDQEAVQKQKLSMEQGVSEIVSVLREKLHMDVKVVIGYPVKTAEELCDAFIDVRQRFNWRNEGAKEVVVLKRDSETKLPPYLRTVLLNAIRSGEREYVQETAGRIFALRRKIADRLLAENYLFSVIGSVQAHLFDSEVEIPPGELDFAQAFLQKQTEEQQEQLLLQKLTAVTDRFAAWNKVRNEDGVYVSEAKAYMKKNLNRDLSLTDVAQQIGINVSYFSRIFKAGTGITPLQYLTNLRIERAKELLTTGRLTIRQIAEELGYNDTRSFNRFFKKLEGCTPKEYREKHL